jgi:hypothetical protein
MARPVTVIVCSHGDPNCKHPAVVAELEDCRTDPVTYRFTDEQMRAGDAAIARAWPELARGRVPRPAAPSPRGGIIRYRSAGEVAGQYPVTARRVSIGSNANKHGRPWAMTCDHCRRNPRVNERSLGTLLDALDKMAVIQPFPTDASGNRVVDLRVLEDLARRLHLLH